MMDSVLASLPEETLKRFAEYAEAIAADERYERAEKAKQLRKFREEKLAALVSGKKFEIVKVYKSDNKIGKLNDFIEFDNSEWALKILEQYRTIAHSIRLHSITLLVDDKLWKKYNIVY